MANVTTPLAGPRTDDKTSGMLRLEFQTRPDDVLHRMHEPGRSLTVDAVLEVENERWLTALTASEYSASPTAHIAEIHEAELIHVQPLAAELDMYHMLVALTASDSFLVQTLVRNQAIPHSIRLTHTGCEGVVTVADWDHLRDLATTIEHRHDTFELVCVKQVDRMGSLLGSGRFTRAVVHGLTHDQLETLKAAYRAGYFTVPQEATASEVAAELGVSQSTFSERLRHATDALLEILFGTPPAGDGTQEGA